MGAREESYDRLLVWGWRGCHAGACLLSCCCGFSKLTEEKLADFCGALESARCTLIEQVEYTIGSSNMAENECGAFYFFLFVVRTKGDADFGLLK